MITLEQFLETHGEVARRIAQHDDVLHECLVLPFNSYVQAYDPAIGTVQGYILMRLRYARLKYNARETVWYQRYGEEITDVVQREEAEGADHTALNAAFVKIDPELQLVLEMWAHGYTQTEIADQLGSSVRKVRSRISAGITSLRKEMLGEV